MRLWLDDIREPWRHGCLGWHWVKSAQEAIEVLKTGRVEEASLDHDLSELRTLGQDDGSATGYDVVCWMEANNVWPSLGTRVHSLNPVGRQRMEEVIERAYRRLVRASIERANLQRASE